MKMMLSVLIPTYNRKEWLLKTLNCVSNQTYNNFEVIIVDASEPEDQLQDANFDNYAFKIDYHRYGTPGNVSKQRNIALKQSKGDILLFLDDDVTFDKDLFGNYIKLFTEERYDAISGLVETEKYRKGSPPIEYKGGRFLKINELNYQPCDFKVETHIICTANFAFKREILSEVIWFDEHLYGVFDDIDFGYHLRRKGYKIIHHPDVAVFHHQVKGSGARSITLPAWWKYYNISYFHLKNLKPNLIEFWISSSWYLLKPSRKWLNLFALLLDYRNFLIGFLKAYFNKKKYYEQ